jgi:ABC-type methionine transport system ATPase subunit
MPVVTVNLTATGEMAQRPLLWRLGRLFHVVTHIRRARITEEVACLTVDIEGSQNEVTQAKAYLHALGLMPGESGENLPVPSTLPQPPETTVSQSVTIRVRIATVAAEQNRAPLLYRVGKDFDVVVNIVRAAFDEEEGGYFEVDLSGPLSEVQRAIAYLHTTGVQVYPYQRSVTDYSNL